MPLPSPWGQSTQLQTHVVIFLLGGSRLGCHRVVLAAGPCTTLTHLLTLVILEAGLGTFTR